MVEQAGHLFRVDRSVLVWELCTEFQHRFSPLFEDDPREGVQEGTVEEVLHCQGGLAILKARPGSVFPGEVYMAQLVVLVPDVERSDPFVCLQPALLMTKVGGSLQHDMWHCHRGCCHGGALPGLLGKKFGG